MADKIRTRLAPSPTGKFHIGTARTALFNYLFAKKNKGEFLLRFEDTDRERSTKEFEDDICEGLKWLGLNWDEEYKQMDRLNIYKKYAKELIKKEIAYEKDGAIWFKIPKDKKIKFKDMIRDEIEFDMKEFNDFVIVKTGGIPTFYFSNVIDDNDMKISHVIRGEDHITNTPKQILIAEALGFNLPVYAHLPLILNDDRSKLSKRKNAVSVSEYKEIGYLPEAIINFLVFLGWNPKTDQEIFIGPFIEGNARLPDTIQPLETLFGNLKKEFSLEGIGKSPAIFDIKKLNYLNGWYIRNISTHLLQNYAQPFLKGRQYKPEFINSFMRVIQRGDITTLGELNGPNYDFYFKEPKYDPKILVFKKSDKDRATKGLSLSISTLENAEGEWGKVEKLNELLAKIVSENNLSNGDVFWPVRVALSGLEKSPSPAELLWALGKEESLKRLGEALKLLHL